MHTLQRAAALVLTSVVFASCSAPPPPRDPASEARVELVPGSYHVTMVGNGLGAFAHNDGPGSVDDNICVHASDAAKFPRNLARNYLQFGDERNCSLKAKERKGNAIGGTLSCRMDPEKAPGGSFNAEYQGAVSADRVELLATLKTNLPRSATARMRPEEARQMEAAVRIMDGLAINLTAERTGECQ